MKRLVSFAMAAVVPGRVVMLDEPTNDVDPVRRRLLWEQVRALADEGAAVLLVTHNVIEAERSVDRLAILDRGSGHRRGHARRAQGRHRRTTCAWSSCSSPARSRRCPRPSCGRYLPNGSRAIATVPADAAPARRSPGPRRSGATGSSRSSRSRPATLEDVYIELVGRADALANGGGDRCARCVATRCSSAGRPCGSRASCPLAMVVQALFALGIVVGYPLLFPELDTTTMLFLATGAPAITLITMGLVAVPQVVAQAKTAGHAGVHARRCRCRASSTCSPTSRSGW